MSENNIDNIEGIIKSFTNSELTDSIKSIVKDFDKTMYKENINKFCSDLISEYISCSDWRVKENANQGYSVGGMILNTSGKVSANYYLNNILPKYISDLHINGDIHIHDLSCLMVYCLGHSLRNLLNEGLNGIPGKNNAKPPKHLSAAIGQMVNFLGCFTDDTEIYTVEYGRISIRELIKLGITTGTTFSYDIENKKFVKSKFYNLHKTRENAELIKLEFKDGSEIKCTPDHKFMLKDGSYKEARYLTEDDDIMDINDG